MVNVRGHLGTDGSAGARGGGGCRLNLLLSYAGWQPESWVDRLPPLLEPLGVRSLRAASGREASEVIRTNSIHIAIVDLGLPLEAFGAAGLGGVGVGGRDATPASLEEGGTRLLEVLSRLPSPPPTVVVKRARTIRDDAREIAAALKSGAFAVIDRPHAPGDVEMLLEVLRRCLARFYKGRWPETA